ncbi:MAG: ribosome biogenesis GTPase Der, partial [Eggerthellaceae bacterium]|nr:ribosome biogenesis GTPase Der [Eggerthellaceae bacterium]
DPWPVSSLHGLGSGDLLDEVVRLLDEAGLTGYRPPEDEGIRIAIIGRPNAGKSSLTNKLTGEERSIVSDVAGTTRDAIDTRVVRGERTYTIVDTAGLRQKSRISEDVEYYGFVRALRAIDRADVAVLVIDASLGLTDLDQHVARVALDRGCAMVVALNKWDLIDDPEKKADIRERLQDRLTFVGFAPIVSMSALTGKNVQRIWDVIDSAYDHFSGTIATSKLNAWLTEIRETGHSVSEGKKILRMKYVTQTKTCPPQFIIFVNHPEIVTDNFERFLENRLRGAFDLTGTPISLKFKRKD